MAGFSHNTSSNYNNQSVNHPSGGNTSGSDVLSLQRQDPGLLYMVSNVLQNVVEVVEEVIAGQS